MKNSLRASKTSGKHTYYEEFKENTHLENSRSELMVSDTRHFKINITQKMTL